MGRINFLGGDMRLLLCSVWREIPSTVETPVITKTTYCKTPSFAKDLACPHSLWWAKLQTAIATLAAQILQ